MHAYDEYMTYIYNSTHLCIRSKTINISAGWNSCLKVLVFNLLGRRVGVLNMWKTPKLSSHLFVDILIKHFKSA